MECGLAVVALTIPTGVLLLALKMASRIQFRAISLILGLRLIAVLLPVCGFFSPLLSDHSSFAFFRCLFCSSLFSRFFGVLFLSCAALVGFLLCLLFLHSFHNAASLIFRMRPFYFVLPLLHFSFFLRSVVILLTHWALFIHFVVELDSSELSSSHASMLCVVTACDANCGLCVRGTCLACNTSSGAPYYDTVSHVCSAVPLFGRWCNATKHCLRMSCQEITEHWRVTVTRNLRADKPKIKVCWVLDCNSNCLSPATHVTLFSGLAKRVNTIASSTHFQLLSFVCGYFLFALL